MNKSDHNLFCKLCAPTHALNHLLPPARNCVGLRTRGHSYQLPEYSTDLHKTSFLVRFLYSFVKYNSFGFICFVLYVILILPLCILSDARLSNLIHITYMPVAVQRRVLVANPFGDTVKFNLANASTKISPLESSELYLWILESMHSVTRGRRLTHYKLLGTNIFYLLDLEATYKIA